MIITLDLYGFEKKVEVSSEVYREGSLLVELNPRLKTIVESHFEIEDIKISQIYFYRDTDNKWRPKRFG